MIGLRTIVLIVIAAALVVVAGLDIGSAVSNGGACDHADSLRARGLLADARKAYVQVLSDNVASDCAKKGIDTVTGLQCNQALAVKALDADGAKKLYLAILTAEPVRAASACDNSAVKSALEGSAP